MVIFVIIDERFLKLKMYKLACMRATFAKVADKSVNMFWVIYYDRRALTELLKKKKIVFFSPIKHNRMRLQIPSVFIMNKSSIVLTGYEFINDLSTFGGATLPNRNGLSTMGGEQDDEHCT